MNMPDIARLDTLSVKVHIEAIYENMKKKIGLTVSEDESFENVHDGRRVPAYTKCYMYTKMSES